MSKRDGESVDGSETAKKQKMGDDATSVSVDFGDRKEIDVSNCARMIGMADRWQIGILRKRCVVFLETKFPTIFTKFRTTLELLIACEELRVHGKALQNVASRLAWFGADVLFEQNVCSYIANTALGAAIFSAAKGLRRDVGDTITRHSPVGDFLPDSACQSSDCSVAMAKMCENCKKFLCQKHLPFVCTTRMTSIVISCGNEDLDARFFPDSE